MADVVMACIVMAYTVMADVLMACMVIAYTVMAYVVMARKGDVRQRRGLI